MFGGRKNEGGRRRERELTNSHDGYSMRGGKGGGGAGIEEQEQNMGVGVYKDWELKFMTLKMTEPGPALRSPLW